MTETGDKVRITTTRARPNPVQHVADDLQQSSADALILTAVILAAPQSAFAGHQQQPIRVVFDMQPTTNVAAVALNEATAYPHERSERQLGTGSRRSEKPIVVRTVAQRNEQVKALVSGANRMV